MDDIVVITLCPRSSYDFKDVKYSVHIHNGDFNRAVRHAVRLAQKSFKDCPVNGFDVLRIEVI